MNTATTTYKPFQCKRL